MQFYENSKNNIEILIFFSFLKLRFDVSLLELYVIYCQVLDINFYL